MRYRLNQSEIDALASRTPAIAGELRRRANRIRTVARRNAPKKTGALARSIGVQKTYDSRSRSVSYKVAWDKAHFYGLFHENGWTDRGGNRHSGREFLTRAAEQVQREIGE